MAFNEMMVEEVSGHCSEIMTYTGVMSLHCYALSTFAALNAPNNDKQRQQCYLSMQFLVERHLDAICKMNRKGMLPFHVAAVHL